MENPDQDYLIELIQKDFSIYPVKKILEILDEYARNSNEVDKIKVCVSIVKLSCMDINKLKHFVSIACKNPDAILFWGD